MDCINCGAPNPKDAIFCKKCGKRLDGMDVCPACGKLTPADGDFCINCGADKSVPPAPVAVSPVPAPAPVNPAANAAASAPMGEAAAAVAEDAVQEEGYMFEKYRGVLKKVSSLFAGLTALMGIIFVFLIECTMSVGSSGASASVTSGENIFYFFGDAYDVIASSLTKNAETVLTAGTLLGTLCCAFGLAITVICFLVAVSRMLKKHGDKTEKGLIAPCAATFISFVCTAVLFMMCINQKSSVSEVEIGYSLGGTAITGIVLGAIFLAIAVATEVMANLKKASLRPCALNGIFSVAMVVFGFVALGVMAGGIVSYALDTSILDTSYSYGLYTLFSNIATFAATSQGSSEYETFNSMYTTELILSIVLVIAAVAFCIFLTAALSKIIGGRGEDISLKTLKHAVIAGLCAVICGVLMIVCTQVYINYLDSDSIESSLTVPIVVMVFGVLLVVVSTVYKNRSKISALGPYLS